MVDTLAAAITSASDRLADVDPTTQQVYAAFLVAVLFLALAVGILVGHVMTKAAR